MSYDIDHLRGDPRAVHWLAAVAPRGDEMWSVVVVRTEVLAGLRRAEERRTWLLLDALKWQDVTTDVADLAGELARSYLRPHPGVDTVDYIVAAAALVVLRRKGEPRITRFVARPMTTSHYYDIGAARRDLGYEPRVSIDEGLARLRAAREGGGRMG